ncbi:MAG: hypothetical protein ACM3X7_11375 [Solirubrobacterales bacterium]
MDNRKVIENYYLDICNLTELLCKLVNSYRLLIGAAEEYNGIALATKKDVKKAIKRANELGEVIDNVIDMLEDANQGYLNYCKVKSHVLEGKIGIEYIESEICPEK